MRFYAFIPSALALAAAMAGGSLHAATVSAGSLVKGSSAAVYYIGADELRYVFPNDKTYFTWYSDFSQVKQISDAELAGFRIGGNVTYRPGTKLVKVQSDPKVYAVDRGGALRPVASEAAALAVWGAGWPKLVDDLPDSFFVNYSVGTPIASVSDYDPVAAKAADQNIADDKKIVPEAVKPPSGADSSPAAASCANSCDVGSACAENQCRNVPGPSNLAVRAFIVDSLNVCFVGDPCANGACCTVGGMKFADNANLRTVLPRDQYLYGSAQTLCGTAKVSSADTNRVMSDLSAWSDAVSRATSNRVNLAITDIHFSGQITLSRVQGTCNWWLAPADADARVSSAADSSTDAVVVVGSKNFDFGEVPISDVTTVDQSKGASGSGYSFIVKESDPDPYAAPAYGPFSSALQSQLSSAVSLGISDPAKPYVGNHCRDGKKDLDEAGIDCGGAQCTPCVR